MKLPFEFLENILTEAKEQLFMSMEKTFDKNDGLNPTETTIFMQSFNHVNRNLYQSDFKAGMAIFAANHNSNVV